MIDFRKTVLAIALTLLGALPGRAQDGVFVSYDAMRASLDTLIMAREIEQMMVLFGAGDEMTPQQLQGLEAQVRQIYAEDFQNKAVMRRADLENGFMQELIAYWTGSRYIYAYVLGHDRDDGFLSINFRFNSDFTKLNQLF
ncbi:hypothetical protein KUH32_14415 [Thalassococcus sp. CAU 1522]|uniref:DUF3887 domain-containing protein n=1 Tax=Thalassococcus arenae TaxID=2851652 RepID=A0ABS6NAC3_9RHOB|nr:hypothetical protein [Thalassococcus arenae]MBV2360957.1 hypothetical protein [Thalassococcus arenae]